MTSTFQQIANAWASAGDDEAAHEKAWLQAAEVVSAYVDFPVGKVRRAPAALCKSMELPTGSSWMEAMAVIADSNIDWEDHPGAETYLQQVRGAQAADNTKRSDKGGAA